jgi:hypothetical protein
LLRTLAALPISSAERDEMTREFGALMTELAESGELIGGEALPGPSRTQKVWVRDGVPMVTDGPFKTKQPRTGDRDCGTLRDARFAAMEVRPLDSAPEA